MAPSMGSDLAGSCAGDPCASDPGVPITSSKRTRGNVVLRTIRRDNNLNMRLVYAVPAQRVKLGQGVFAGQVLAIR